jgi:hypothetical protein
MGVTVTILFVSASMWVYYTFTTDEDEFVVSADKAVYLSFLLMTGVGWLFEVQPDTYGVWTMLVMDCYIFITVPLFTIFIAHLAAEVDVGDQQHYMQRVARDLFNGQDRHLLKIFDSEWDPKADGYGIREIHVLLIVRMQETHVMDPLLNTVLDMYDYRAGIVRVGGENVNSMQGQGHGLGSDGDGSQGSEGEDEGDSFFSTAPELGPGGIITSSRPASSSSSPSLSGSRLRSRKVHRKASCRLQQSNRRPPRRVMRKEWVVNSDFPYVHIVNSSGPGSGFGSGLGLGGASSSTGNSLGFGGYGSFYDVNGSGLHASGGARAADGAEEHAPFLMTE